MSPRPLSQQGNNIQNILHQKAPERAFCNLCAPNPSYSSKRSIYKTLIYFMKIKKFFAAGFIVLGVFSSASLVMAQVVSPPIYPTPQQYCPQLSYNLYVGLTDYATMGQVTQLQQFLSTRYSQPITGYFGAITRANVAQFQREQNVYPITGGVGPLTRAAIARVCGGSSYQGPVSVAVVSPSQGAVGTQVAIYGNGFTQDNRVHFGVGGAVHVPSYNGGTLLYFTIPTAVGPCSWAGDTSPIRCFVADQQVLPGTYQISVENTNGQSNSINFVVTQANQHTSLTITSPQGGVQYQNGTQMPIAWSMTNPPSSNSSMILDLYTGAGAKVGTIAISSNTSGSYNWSIPRVPNNLLCTMQYPNGLCGVALSGQYYIKATLVSGSGFDSNATTYTSTNSAVFTIY